MRSRSRFPKEDDMPKFVIEREIPGAGKLTDQQGQAISKKSCAVPASMKGAVQWQHSYVTDDKLYCIYVAPNEEAVRPQTQPRALPPKQSSPGSAALDPTTTERG